jgi:RimJ/RimL family protein N-acetyltransferase
VSKELCSPVELVAIDEAVLDELLQAATGDAAAHEVTPPQIVGATWTPGRVSWLRSFHRERRDGLCGPAGEATWAVRVDGHVVGSVRLKRTSESRVLETGIWLTRHARGRGLGRAAVAAVLSEATDIGADVVQADTTATNAGALGVLRSLGFTIGSADNHGELRAQLRQPFPDRSR